LRHKRGIRRNKEAKDVRGGGRFDWVIQDGSFDYSPPPPLYTFNERKVKEVI